MAKFEVRVQAEFFQLTQQIRNDILASAVSIQLVDESHYTGEKVQVITSVYDKYYMRNGSRASLTVTLVQDGQYVYVSTISAGGGNGALFRFNWGAEEDFARVVEQSLRNHGYLR